MGYIDQHLISGEQVAYRSGLHWSVLIRSMVVAAVLGLSGFAILFESATAKGERLGEILPAIGLGAILIGAIDLLAAIVRRRSAEFAVTNKRIMLKRGVIRRSSEEIFLRQVESVIVEESMLGRVLDYGTIRVRGTGGTPEPYRNIAHAQEFRRHIQEQISTNR